MASTLSQSLLKELMSVTSCGPLKNPFEFLSISSFLAFDSAYNNKLAYKIII